MSTKGLPTRKQRKFDPANVTMTTPLRIDWLAQYLRISRTIIYKAISNGYTVKYPKIRMTTAEHFLAWAENQEVEPKEVKEKREGLIASLLHPKAKGKAKT